MDCTNVEIGYIDSSKVFTILTPEKIKDYLEIIQ